MRPSYVWGIGVFLVAFVLLMVDELYLGQDGVVTRGTILAAIPMQFMLALIPGFLAQAYAMHLDKQEQRPSSR